MKKRLLSLLLTGVLALSLSVSAFAAPILISPAPKAGPAVQVEGKVLTLTEGAARIVKNRTFVPGSELLTALGVEHSTKGENITATRGKGTVKLVLGALSFAITAGEETRTVPLDVAAFTEDGVVYLPLRALCESLGYRVGWDPKTGTATVTTPVEIALKLTVTGQDGKAVTKEYKTTEAVLGNFLEQAGIAVSELGPYGRFITTVNGYKVDAAKNEWWCITKDGKDVMTGADSTPIGAGDSFELTLKTY
ncbi:MAG: stalk domain-containing protein [Oscillospiraceae bacterium]